MDVTEPGDWPELPQAQTILFAVGFDRTAGMPIQEVYVQGLRNLLQRVPPATQKLIYISSTGVYGRPESDWVDEDSACRPIRPGGKACLAAEQSLRSHPLGERSVVLRLAGIYGPGRIPRRDRVARQLPITADPAGYLNLIHVDDAVQTILAADERAAPPRTYAVSDGNPTPRGEFYEYLARRMGVPTPEFCEPGGKENDRRSAESKRVSNRRMLEELEVQLAYPNYRLGLNAIFSADPHD
jgi:nucleoside-diphosphate-sugar epimerase